MTSTSCYPRTVPVQTIPHRLCTRASQDGFTQSAPPFTATWAAFITPEKINFPLGYDCFPFHPGAGRRVTYRTARPTSSYVTAERSTSLPVVELPLPPHCVTVHPVTCRDTQPRRHDRNVLRRVSATDKNLSKEKHLDGTTTEHTEQWELNCPVKVCWTRPVQRPNPPGP